MSKIGLTKPEVDFKRKFQTLNVSVRASNF